MRKMYSKEQLLNIIANKYNFYIVEFNEEYPEALQIGIPVAYIDVLGDSSFSGNVTLPNLPTEDPHSQGQLWNDNGTLKVSTGE